MSGAYLILLFVAVQRVVELLYANYNTKRLLAEGAKEFASEHYKWIVLLHSVWLITLFIAVHFHFELHLAWLALFFGFQLLRIWVLKTLGHYWTTKIIRPRDNFIVTSGPYRFFRHPNYLVVVGEIFALPMALGWPMVGLIFSILNFCVLGIRIRAENSALGFSAVKRHS